MIEILQQFLSEIPIIFWNLVIWLSIIVLLTFLNPRIQMAQWISHIEKGLSRLMFYASKSRDIAVGVVKERGKPDKDPAPLIDDFLGFFVIEPVERDPFGVLKRLEHLIDVMRERFKEFVAKVAPKSGKDDAANLENVLAVAIALNYLYRVVRHYLLLGKKMKSMFLLMQIEMAMPLIMRMAEAYFNSLNAFTQGKPLGDGVGCLVAAKLMQGYPVKNVEGDIVIAEVPFEQRTLLVLKAEGPGGRVGKPGDAIAKVVEGMGGRVARIIMVDAGMKLEGETLGHVVEGVGAAIGDPGPEKYKIEEVAVKYKVPLDSIIIKESLEDAITPMKKPIAEAADLAVERVKRIVRERLKEGEVAIVAGIGNTSGIGQ